jgi:cytidylate kinase
LVTSNQWANVTTNENAATVEDARADLVQRRIEARILTGTTAQKNAAVVLRAQLDILAERIAKRNGSPYGASAGQATEEVARTRRGPPRWQVLGLAELPTIRELGGAP